MMSMTAPYCTHCTLLFIFFFGLESLKNSFIQKTLHTAIDKAARVSFIQALILRFALGGKAKCSAAVGMHQKDFEL